MMKKMDNYIKTLFTIYSVSIFFLGLFTFYIIEPLSYDIISFFEEEDDDYSYYDSITSYFNIDPKHRNTFVDAEDIKIKNSNGKLIIEFNNEESCYELAESVGYSMYPYFKFKSKMIIDKCFEPQNLEVGDMIVFKKEGRWIGHRIIIINYDDKWITTQGDNSPGLDESISFNEVIGKIVTTLNTYYDDDTEGEEYLKDLLAVDPNEFIFDENTFYIKESDIK